MARLEWSGWGFGRESWGDAFHEMEDASLSQITSSTPPFVFEKPRHFTNICSWVFKVLFWRFCKTAVLRLREYFTVKELFIDSTQLGSSTLTSSFKQLGTEV